MEANAMTPFEIILLIVAIGAYLYFMMYKGGSHDHGKDQGGGDNEHPKGGCC